MTPTKQPIRLHVFYHDDVSASTRRIVPRNYLKDCVTEIGKVTGRAFVISYLHSIPGVTDFNYKGAAQTVLNEWIHCIDAYKAQNGLPDGKTHRYLLVTNQPLSEIVNGVAYHGEGELIASLASYQTIAHELGHSFNANHHDAELQTNAWGATCETYVYPNRDPARANCYSYSLQNRENIARFLADEE